MLPLADQADLALHGMGGKARPLLCLLLGATASCPSTCALPVAPEVSEFPGPSTLPPETKGALDGNVLCQPTPFDSMKTPFFALSSFFPFSLKKKKSWVGGEARKGLERGRHKTPANPSLLWGVETSALSQQFERKQKIAKWYKI